jgi:hypothetical protein
MGESNGFPRFGLRGVGGIEEGDTAQAYRMESALRLVAIPAVTAFQRKFQTK